MNDLEAMSEFISVVALLLRPSLSVTIIMVTLVVSGTSEINVLI